MINQFTKQENMTALFVKTCRKSSIALIFMLFLQSVSAQYDFSGLSASLKKNEKVLGKETVVVVQKEGKHIFLKEGEEHKLKSPVSIGSAGTWFTTAVVLMLADEGKLDLDDPISKYIPIFEKHMKGYITLRNCITHTTGLDGDASGVMKLSQKNKFENLQEQVEYFATKKLIVDNPGEAFSFSSVGPTIAGRILEIITKKTFDRLITEKLFRPAGMRTATFYNETGGATDPARGATCSAFDYLSFMQMILNNGMLNGKQVMSEKAVQQMLTMVPSEIKRKFLPETYSDFGYTMGAWVQEEEDGKPTVLCFPNLDGAWPLVDLQKKYCAIILPPKPLSSVPRKEFYLQFKSAVDNTVEQ